MKRTWNGILRVIAPNGSLIKEMRRRVKGEDLLRARKNASYMIKPWSHLGRVEMELTLDSTEGCE